MKNLELARVFALIVGVAALNAGCVAHAQAGVSGEAQPPVVFTEPPTLVAIDGSVWVVRDADYATYYVEDWYWVYRDGTWYRSRAYDGGWVVAEVSIVPTVIVHRDHAKYVFYRGEATARTRRAPHEGERAREAAADTPNDTHGHDELRGTGDRRAAHDSHEEGAENGRHKDGPAKDESPGVGNERKSEGAQPGAVGKGGTATPSPKKTEKKHEKP